MKLVFKPFNNWQLTFYLEWTQNHKIGLMHIWSETFFYKHSIKEKHKICKKNQHLPKFVHKRFVLLMFRVLIGSMLKLFSIKKNWSQLSPAIIRNCQSLEGLLILVAYYILYLGKWLIYNIQFLCGEESFFYATLLMRLGSVWMTWLQKGILWTCLVKKLLIQIGRDMNQTNTTGMIYIDI